MRTADQYIEGLRDEREIHYRGEQIDDVTSHDVLGVCVRHGASIFGEPPRGVSDQDWAVEEGGRTFSGYYAIPRSSEALLRRARLIESHTRSQYAQFNILKAVGSDALCALSALGDRLGRLPNGTSIAKNVEAYVKRCQEEDLATVVAQTDAKGDRSKTPSQQSLPRAYLRCVDVTADGPVVRGAKVHTTSAPVADEIIVLPTRAMRPGEEDYALAFAIPAATQGLRMVSRPVREALDRFDNPVSSRAFEIECVTLFDDVQVPWERVFLFRNDAMAGEVARTFATFHRFTGLSYKPPLPELLLGVVSLIVKDNGLEGKAPLTAKLAEMANYVSVIRACRTASAVESRVWDNGVHMPDPVSTNAGKHFFARYFHDLAMTAQDLAGGLTVTAPSGHDLYSGSLVSQLEETLAGTNLDARRRVTAFNILRDLTASELGGYNYVASLHGEGSIAAQLLMAAAEFDIQSAESLASSLIEDVVEEGPTGL